MLVVATAGHVGHGKSTLVRALAGMEPGGLTLDLAFAWTELATGEGLALVDVPGHERLLTTMLAGAGPVPAVLLAVAADEGWMPQTEEHLGAVDALGVRHGVLVVTRSDVADPKLALRQARDRLATTGLKGIEAVTVSAVTGAGLDELRAALVRLAARVPAPDPAAPVRLWIDLAFTEPGGGTVVTGTLPAGTVAADDELLLLPAGDRVRVRAVEVAERPAESVSGVARVALDLSGVPRERVARGMVLATPGGWALTSTVDVRIRFAEASGRLSRQMTLHIGAAAVPVRLRPLGPDTARLTLNARLPLHVGDTALLRDPERRLMAGVSVLDVRPPALVRKGAAAARARELATWPDTPDGGVVLRRHGVLRLSELALMGCAPPRGAVILDDWAADPDHWRDLYKRLTDELAHHAETHPLTPGLNVEAARLRLGLPTRQLVIALARPPLRLADGRLYGPSGPVPPQVTAAVARLGEHLASPFQAPTPERLAELGLTGEVLDTATRIGAVLRLGGDVVLLPGADRQALRVLSGLAQPFSAEQARQALGTTRRVALALLEHLDAQGRTHRTGNDRRVPDGPPSPPKMD
ncbi:SelB domain-containing protein [Spirillospora sp. CA-294931]|uniref:SelB domain-containing protein n=1 Tax=Spirillospora sp. CA-294931 TaxID=3240042 RepID=UPI003D900EC0